MNIGWRFEEASAEWQTHHVDAVPDGNPVILGFDALPAEFWAVLQQADGKILDRRGWSPREGVRPADPDTNLVRLACVVGENEHIEFKEALSSKGDANLEFAESVAAFANCGGGTILLGINDAAEIVGFQRQGLVDTIMQIVRANVVEYVAVGVSRVEVDGKPVWIVEVPDGNDKPYRCRDRVLVRAGATDRAATTAELRRLSAPPMAGQPFPHLPPGMSG
jgi:hypothetical protein